tara:strand:- start:1645 stop:1842 length:198 start_codon:yes stop_codon:yes gene_type:complete
MVHLNYNNLDAATQERLLLKSKQEIEQRFGYDLNKYAIQKGLPYNEVLEEEAIRNLYNYSDTFTI